MSVIMSRPVHDPKYAGAEKETAAGVAAAKTVMSVGTYTNGTIPDIAVVGQGAPQLVQLCVRMHSTAVSVTKRKKRRQSGRRCR